MNEGLTCRRVEEEGWVELYLSHRLGEDREARFEGHLLSCRRCQDAVKMGAGVRVLGARDAGGGRGRAARWLGAGGLAAAAVLAAVLLLPSDGPGPEILRLGQVGEPPVYLGVPVRAGPADSAGAVFDRAMEAYAAGEYERAAAGLREATDRGFDPVTSRFFIGASLLALDRPEEARRAFGTVVAAGPSPYLQEARFYRAKAALRMGRVAAALADLERAATGEGVVAAHARALRDSVEAARAP